MQGNAFASMLRQAEAGGSLRDIWSNDATENIAPQPTTGAAPLMRRIWLSLRDFAIPKQPVAPVRERDACKPLSGYPVYDPPHRGSINRLGPRFLCDRYPGRENFEHFMGQKAIRLQALDEYLRTFGLPDLDPANDDFLDALSAWCGTYLGTLAEYQPSDDRIRNAFFDHSERWEGELIGLNVIFDLGIVLGDGIIARNIDRYWDLMQIVDINPMKRRYHPMHAMFGMFHNYCVRSRGGRISSPDSLKLVVRARAKQEARKRSLRFS